MPDEKIKIGAISAALQTGIKNLKDLSPIAEDLARVCEQSAVENLDSQGTRGGKRWDPLKESTVKQRVRLGYGKTPIGIRTGKLRAFLSKAAEPSISNDGKRILITFSNGDSKLAKIGAVFSYGKKDQTPRQILKLNGQDKAIIKRLAIKAAKNAVLLALKNK